MKAKELAKKLMENEDFDVEFNFSDRNSSKLGFNLRNFNNIDIGDIGYSEKVIVLGGDEEK